MGSKSDVALIPKQKQLLEPTFLNIYICEKNRSVRLERQPFKVVLSWLEAPPYLSFPLYPAYYIWQEEVRQ